MAARASRAARAAGGGWGNDKASGLSRKERKFNPQCNGPVQNGTVPPIHTSMDNGPASGVVAHILVVDDDREIRDLLARFLASAIASASPRCATAAKPAAPGPTATTTSSCST